MMMIYTVTNLYGDVVPITVAENIAAKGSPNIQPARHGIIAIFADLRGTWSASANSGRFQGGFGAV